MGAAPVVDRLNRSHLEALAARAVHDDGYVAAMAPPQLYFNKNCSTARKAKDALDAAGVEVEVVEYLKAPPDRATLERLVAAVDSPPADLVRKDKRFKELGLDADAYTTPDAVVALLVEHPELLQRPILVHGDRAVIGRPPERVLELVD